MISALRNILTWILLVTITIGYAGVPLSKMICTQDGHVEVALLGNAEGCSHNSKPLKKSCCESTADKDDADENCCNFEHAFNKLSSAFTLTKSNIQIKAYVQFMQLVSFISALFTTGFHPTQTLLADASPPPLLRHGSHFLSMIQVYRL
jgi:hypothetical protein